MDNLVNIKGMPLLGIPFDDFISNMDYFTSMITTRFK